RGADRRPHPRPLLRQRDQRVNKTQAGEGFPQPSVENRLWKTPAALWTATPPTLGPAPRPRPRLAPGSRKRAARAVGRPCGPRRAARPRWAGCAARPAPPSPARRRARRRPRRAPRAPPPRPASGTARRPSAGEAVLAALEIG